MEGRLPLVRIRHGGVLFCQKMTTALINHTGCEDVHILEITLSHRRRFAQIDLDL